MKVQIEVSIVGGRLAARTSDGTVWIDEPGLVALAPSSRSPTGQRIAAIGREAESQHASAVVPAFSTTHLDVGITSRVIEWAALFAWSRVRPELRGLIAALDQVDVRVELEGYAALSREQRAALQRVWPYHPQIRWWLQGEKVPQ